jgi:hypothetical protein
MMSAYTAKEKGDAIGRELVYRRRVYKRLVQDGKMKMEAAMFQIAVFEAIEADYLEAQAGGSG